MVVLAALEDPSTASLPLDFVAASPFWCLGSSETTLQASRFLDFARPRSHCCQPDTYASIALPLHLLLLAFRS